MWNLETLRLIQFFLFDSQEIRLGDVTGVFGPNGSGKSTLLDAVQIAMMGANTRHIALNAQADENKSTRSIRGYCLGQFGEGSDQRARDEALTYITLIFRNSQTGEPVSMGVCIQASGDVEGHEVLGRYLLRGVELSMGDHIQTVDREERPRDWPAFRVQLQERSKVSGDDPLFPDSERYIRAVLLALRGSGGMPSVEAFTRAFRFALRMRFDRPVDGIVRHDVLESRPTNIKKFREITESFRRLVDLVRQIEEKINEGAGVEEAYARALRMSREAKTWEFLEQEVKVGMATDAINATVEREQKAAESLETLREQLAQSNAAMDSATANLQRIAMLRTSHSAHQEHGLLQSELAIATTGAEEKGKKILHTLNAVARILKSAADAPPLLEHSSVLRQHAQSIEVASGSLDEMTLARLESTLRPALKASDEAFGIAVRAVSAVESEVKEADAQIKAVEAGLARAREGKVQLSGPVQRLMNELADQGVQAQAVCDLVRITDPSWQSSIESFLGPNLEALLVRDDQEKDAFRIYRGLRGKQAIYGVKLVVEGKQRIGGTPEKGAIAELIQGDNVAAISFLRRQFGPCRQAERDDEALAGAYTLTRDGMLNKSGEIERLRPVSAEDHRIGAGGASQRHLLQGEVSRLLSQKRALEGKRDAIRRVVDDLRRIGGSASAMQDILRDWHEFEGAKKTFETLTFRLNQEADTEYVRLGEQEQAQAREITELREVLGDLNKKFGAADNALTQAQARRTEAESDHAQKQVVADQLRAHEDFDSEEAAKKWDGLLERYPGDYPAMQNHCRGQVDTTTRHRESAISTGSAKLGGFLSKYREHVPPTTMDDWRSVYAWIRDFLKKLRDTDLLTYKTQMEEAYRTSQETFRTDVAVALSNNLDWLDTTMHRLNGVLGTCPVFSNGERYKFVRHARPQLKPLLDFIKSVATHGPAEDLLGGPSAFPEQFKELLEEKAGIGGAGAVSPLDDYREFFEFDVEILREDPITKGTKLIGHLSKRLGPGSGGEHRAPLYVIAGAALSSAYRIERGVVDGIRLILLDEAFNKMDMNNIIATLRYFEGLGLQVFMASPGENHGILSAFLHRYYDILRDADNNALLLQGHEMSEEARQIMRSDLAEFNPELIEEELAAMQRQLTNRSAQAA